MEGEAAQVEGRSYWGMSGRECDSCRSSPATLFCRADSAFLCSACDSRVHSANKLASRHERVWLCEVCEQSPAAVTCKADAAVLCLACDADIHSANPLARRHERIPVVPFTSSTNATAPPLHRREDDERKPHVDDPAKDDSDEVASWLLLPNPNTSSCNTTTTTTTASTTKKDTSDGLLFGGDVAEPYPDFDYAFHVPETSPYDLDFVKVKPPASSFYAPSLCHSVSSSEVGVVPDGGGMAEISNACVTGVPANPTAVAAVAAGVDREARVMRYREKRKNRKFQKTIRYASRKAYAETRPRIKGRFAKRTDSEPEPGVGSGIYMSTAILDTGYGVVPSF